ncbi:MAG: host attachment protein [Bdellovibrionales bacterium]|nr:host attachment protein [Bdellovibrionales bacterium]
MPSRSAHGPAFTAQLPWVVAANRAGASFYHGRPGTPVKMLRRIEHPEGRMSNAELGGEKPGRVPSSVPGSAARHGLEYGGSETEHEAERFAAEVGKELGRAAHAQEFTELVLVAEPRFLGMLRKHFTPAVISKLKQEIHADFARGTEKDLEALLAKHA